MRQDFIKRSFVNPPCESTNADFWSTEEDGWLFRLDILYTSIWSIAFWVIFQLNYIKLIKGLLVNQIHTIKLANRKIQQQLYVIIIINTCMQFKKGLQHNLLADLFIVIGSFVKLIISCLYIRKIQKMITPLRPPIRY